MCTKIESNSKDEYSVDEFKKKSKNKAVKKQLVYMYFVNRYSFRCENSVSQVTPFL